MSLKSGDYLKLIINIIIVIVLIVIIGATSANIIYFDKLSNDTSETPIIPPQQASIMYGFNWFILIITFIILFMEVWNIYGIFNYEKYKQITNLTHKIAKSSVNETNAYINSLNKA